MQLKINKSFILFRLDSNPSGYSRVKHDLLLYVRLDFHLAVIVTLLFTSSSFGYGFLYKFLFIARFDRQIKSVFNKKIQKQEPFVWSLPQKFHFFWLFLSNLILPAIVFVQFLLLPVLHPDPAIQWTQMHFPGWFDYLRVLLFSDSSSHTRQGLSHIQGWDTIRQPHIKSHGSEDDHLY